MFGKAAQQLVRGLVATIFVALLAARMGAEAQTPAAGEARQAVLLDLDGIVSPATADYLVRGIAEAETEGATLIILRMDTPGGLDTSMRQIIRAILASSVPVVAWVAPGGARAASAGTYILYASHVAAMAPGTNLGAATPIRLGGGTPFGGDKPEGGEKKSDKEKDAEPAPGDPESAKMVNDAAAYIRSLADLRGRNAEWAESAVRKAESLPAREALEKNVIDLIAADVDDLLKALQGRTVEIAGEKRALKTAGLNVQRIEPGWRTKLLGIIAHPNVAFILLAVGMYGIIFEFASPGMVAPGVIGAISLVLGLFALNVMPIDYTGIALMLLGFAFMVAEAFAPSFGVLGLGGSAAFAVGAIMAFNTGTPGYQLSIALVIGLTATTAGLVIVALTMLVRSRHRKVETGGEALIGAKGRVLNWSGDHGQVRVMGERWQARSTLPLLPDQPVEVAGREGFTLLVQPRTDTIPKGEARQ